MDLTIFSFDWLGGHMCDFLQQYHLIDLTPHFSNRCAKTAATATRGGT